jgi:hypothetical protein
MGAFSPGNLLAELAGALHALRDRVPNGWGGTPKPDEDPLQLTDDDERLTPLAGVGEKKPALDLHSSEDDGPPAENGVSWKAPRDAQGRRRSKRNLQDELDARSAVRVAVHNGGPEEFAREVPADVLDRITVDDRALWALELLGAVCDELPVYGMRWLRDEAVDHLTRRTRRRPIFRGKPKPLKDHINDYVRGRIAGHVRAGDPEELIARKLGLQDKAPATKRPDNPPPVDDAVRQFLLGPPDRDAYFDRLLDELLLAGRRVIVDELSLRPDIPTVKKPLPRKRSNGPASYVTLERIRRHRVRASRP